MLKRTIKTTSACFGTLCRYAGGVLLPVLAGAAMFGAIAGLAAERSSAESSAADPPLIRHPDNGRYFLFRDKPTVLVTSGEHYGAVLNRDFDYLLYLDELARHGLNQTRTFSGVYCEPPGAFNIKRNTLAPAAGRLIAPWARSDQDGYAGGGNRFDLERWDEAYFARLKDFVAQAGKRGVVVELVLFCPFYEDAMWDLSPMKADNNVQGIGNVPRTEVYTLKHPELTAVQERVARKLAGELVEFDNVYFEICNEPYFGGVTDAWERHMADVVAEALDAAGAKHLIAQNIANGSKKVEDPHPAISVFNFHYANPPRAVAENYDLERVIGFDETGFRGSGDFVYRADGWEFLIAGGAVYSHLDYSFAVGHEDGSAAVEAPGGGGAAIRAQLATLKRFIEGFDFVRMAPRDAVVRSEPPADGSIRALVEEGRQYAVYVRGGGLAKLSLELPAGSYRARWLAPDTGEVLKRHDLQHAGDAITLETPPYGEDLALAIRRR